MHRGTVGVVARHPDRAKGGMGRLADQSQDLYLSPSFCGCGCTQFDQRLADILLRAEDVSIADRTGTLDDGGPLLLDGVGERTLPPLLVDLNNETLHRRIVGLEIA